MCSKFIDGTLGKITNGLNFTCYISPIVMLCHILTFHLTIEYAVLPRLGKQKRMLAWQDSDSR